MPAHADAEEADRRNALELGFTHTFQLLRTSPSEAEAGRSENLWGFVLAYERILIPERLALVIAKPFHFTKDRFDSPLDVFLKVSFPKDRWDPYVGAGVSGNARFFSGELEQEEGRRVEYTFGVGAIAGVCIPFHPALGPLSRGRLLVLRQWSDAARLHRRALRRVDILRANRS